MGEETDIGPCVNYDPFKFCWQCQKSKPREGFRQVRPGSNRKACADCVEKVREIEREKTV